MEEDTQETCKHDFISWHGSRGECQECGKTVSCGKCKDAGCMFCCHFCNTDMHRCRGCGAVIEHGQTTCVQDRFE